MICQIEKMAQGGRAIARLDGKIVFVDGALPGEEVEIEILKSRKDFAEAKVMRILQKHPLRIEPTCKHYGQCGGCNLQHASIELQRTLKKQVVEDLFRRQARIPLNADWPLHGGQEWAYRGRVRFVQTPKGLGFRAEGSNQTLRLSECPVLRHPIQKALQQSHNIAVGEELQLLEAPSGTLGAWQKKSSQKPKVQYAELLGKKISCDAQVFFQANVEMTEVLLQQVLLQIERHMGPRLFAVDLFSGVGVFAAFLQDYFPKVVAVEWNEGCLEHAKRNLQSQVEFYSKSAEEFLEKQPPANVDFLIVDPPRAGLSPSVKQALIQAHPKKMLYVSCDPVTLARDVGELVRAGFTLENVQGFDFYPQTDHLEMMVVLS